MAQTPIDSITDSITLKGEMNMQNILHIHSTDVRGILHALAAKRDEAPQFFLRSPLTVDCKAIEADSDKLDFNGLMKGIRALRFVPIGVRHVSPQGVQLAMDSGWAILRDSKAKQVAIKPSDKNRIQQNIEDQGTEGQGKNQQVSKPAATHDGHRVMVINRPVRSGQQVYSPDGDIVVLSQTGAGSEVLADGSVHVYGNICGRVLAGVNGDRSARIFCQGLEAELIAIAGNYQLLDEIDTQLKGQPAMISLDGDTLKIEPMI
ncbi:MAG: septum site-determining protein MinC [Thiotrichaceae bacterium]